MLPTMHGEFRLVEDPELRFTPSGAAVANVRLVANGRRLNKQTQEWEDAGELWISGSVWKQQAENVAESLTKGMLVMVTGKVQTRSWEKDGEKRSVIELMIDDIAPSLKQATARVTKTERQGGQRQAPAADDPWANPAAPPAPDPWATPDEPPY